MLLKAFSFIREAEHKSLENLQPDNVTEKKNLFSGEKFKLAAEICINNEEANVIHQDNGENVSRTCQRSLCQPLSSQAQRSRRKKWFHGPGLGFQPCVQPRYLVPCIPTAPVMAKRGQCTARAMASEVESFKPSQFPCGVEPADAQKSIIEVWESPPKF